MTWEPIETAPTDGTRFLTVQRNQKTYELQCVIAYYRLTSHSRQLQLIGARKKEATHWMPLPEVPE